MLASDVKTVRHEAKEAETRIFSGLENKAFILLRLIQDYLIVNG